jgi:hypothetical protein
MLIITILFVIALWLAHLAVGRSDALTLHISQMRSLTVFAHCLFILLIGAAVCFARRARQERHDLSAVLGVAIAFSIFGAWLTPTVSRVHDLLASSPFILLFLYVPIMLLHGGHFLAACLTFIVPPICNMLLWLAAGGSSGQLQKLNALLFLALLNFLYYRVLPATHPLLHPPYLDGRKPRLTGG